MSDLRTNDDFFEFAQSLTHIHVDDLRELFGRFDIKIPLHVHRFVLRETIAPEVFDEMRYASYSDELKYRLKKYREYPVFLYEKLIHEQDFDFDASRYKEMLFDMLFVNRDLYELTSLFYEALKELRDNTESEAPNLSYQAFYDALRPVFYQLPGFLDGVPLDHMKEILVESCTLGELRSLGDKYGVKIPRRINKQELIDMLGAKLRLTDEERQLLEKKSVLNIEMYAKEKGFKISTDLKKADMVEYLSYRLDLYGQESKEDRHVYDIPLFGETEEPVKEETTDQETPGEDTGEPIPVTDAEEASVETMAEQTETDIEEDMDDEETVSEPEPQPEPELEPEDTQTVNMDVPETEDKTEEEQTLEDEAGQTDEITARDEPVKQEKTPETDRPEEDADELRAVLDEKIDEIIREYNKRKRRKRIWVSILIIFIVLVVAAVGYGLIYYNYIDYGNLPFGIPVFWE